MLQPDTPLESVSKITPRYAGVLKKLGLFTVRDFLQYFPFRYDDFSKAVTLSDEYLDRNVTVEGKVVRTKNVRIFPKRMTLTEIIIQDKNNTPLKAVWFNQPFILNSLGEGISVRLSGKLTLDGKFFAMNSPAWERASRDTTNTGRLVPVYSETTGLTSKWIRWQMKMILPIAKQLDDILPTDIRKKYNLYDFYTALTQIHFPDSREKLIHAQKRFAFEEMFLVQIKALQVRGQWESNKSIPIKFDENLIKDFVARLPFKLTDAQRKSAFEILRDLEKNRPMNRLLEGDVGSGKTVVAAIAALQVISSGYQVALMAPTEILAYQHFKSFCELFKDYDYSIALLTNSYKLVCHCERSEACLPARQAISKLKHGIAAVSRQGGIPRNDILKKISSGYINLVIGTHALIQEDIKFNNLALAIIDEQHRFGVAQRAALQHAIQTNADLTQTDTEDNDNLLYKDLTYKIRGAVFKVKKQLGLGHKENIYQKALTEELSELKLFFEKEKVIDIWYNDKKIGVYKPDFVVECKVILELKALPSVGKFEKQQVWHYLKGSNYKLALLINFGREDIEIDRFIHSSPHKSASNSHKSVSVPHLLTMTATPIPRTLAIAFFGSLDLSILDEMPKNRKPIITKVIPPAGRETAYDFIKKEIKNGRQAFIVLPFVEESKVMVEVKAAVAEHKRLSEEIFSGFKLGLLHGRLKSKEKEKVMREFASQKLDILVSTPVVEVGIDVPNATVMLIENAERFGLSQLHQFRGRVGRSVHQSYCFLFNPLNAADRLEALEKTNDGFEISKIDLELRGPGQFFGTFQSGLPDIAMENLGNVKLIKFARMEAQELLKNDPQLKKHPLLAEALKKFQEKIHLE